MTRSLTPPRLTVGVPPLKRIGERRRKSPSRLIRPCGPAALVLRVSSGLVGYVVVGYPLLAALLAHLRPRPVQSSGISPRVTLIIPCHNEADVIVKKLASIAALEYDSDCLETIVVDDGSTDSTADLARASLSAGTVIELPQCQGKALAVNAALEVASADIIVLSDATALLRPDALRLLVRGFADPSVGVISGAMVYQPGGVARGLELYWRYEDAIRVWESRSGTTVGVNGNLFAIRRECMAPLPPGTVNDESTLALLAAAAGNRVIFEPAAGATDLASPTMGDESQRRERITAGRLQTVFGASRVVWRRPGLAFRLVSHKLLRVTVPLMILAAIPASIVTVS